MWHMLRPCHATGGAGVAIVLSVLATLDTLTGCQLTGCHITIAGSRSLDSGRVFLLSVSQYLVFSVDSVWVQLA